MPEYTSPVRVKMDDERMATFLCQLPSDCRVTVRLTHSKREQELMARDFPREGRRFTNLTSGTEWFITPESLNRVGVVAIDVHPFTINYY